MAVLRNRSAGLYDLVGADAVDAAETSCGSFDVGLGTPNGEPGPCPAVPCSRLDCYRRRAAAYQAGEPITVSSWSLPREAHWSWRDPRGLLAVRPDGTVRLAENVEP